MLQQPVALLVLAGGMGSRFGGDKQLATLGTTERTLLHFNVLDAYRAGVRVLHLVVRENLIAAFEQQVLPHFPDDLTVYVSCQRLNDLPVGVALPSGRQKPWGTAHAVWAAREQLTSPFIVINADDYYGPAAMTLLVQHFQQSSQWAMVAYPVAATLSDHGGVNRGCCEVVDGCLRTVTEWTEIQQTAAGLVGLNAMQQPSRLPDSQLVSMNIWGFTPAIIPQLENALQQFFQADPGPKGECYLPAVVDHAIKQQQQVLVYTSNEHWYGVTYAADLPLITRIFEQKMPQYQG